MPRSITLEDAGLFQMICHLGGISHPPGYPVFTQLCQPMVAAFSAAGIPPIISGNLVSAMFAAGASVMFFLFCRMLTGSLLFACLAGFSWSFGNVFWSQAIIIEVYSLAALLFMTCAWLLLKYVRTEQAIWWYGAALVFSLGLSNHWPLMVLSAPALAALVSPAFRQLMTACLSPRFWLLTISCFLLGLIPYLTLLTPDPFISVTGPVSSFDELIHHILRSGYGSENGSISDFRGYFDWLAGLTLAQTGYLGIPFLLAGVYFCGQRFGFYLFLTILLMWAGSTWILAALVEFRFTELGKAFFQPYTVIAMAAPAFWFATGVTTMAELLKRRYPITETQVSLLGTVLIIVIFIQHYPINNRSQDYLVESYAESVLNTLPENAVLFVEGDNETGPIGYLHHVEQLRLDVEVRSWRNTVFQNRLASPYAPHAEREQLLAEFINQSERPVFVIRPSVEPYIDYGAYTKTRARGYALEPTLLGWLDYLLLLHENNLVQDRHELRFVQNRLDGFARLLLAVPEPTGPLQALIERLLQTFPGKLVQLEQILRGDSSADTKQEALDWITKINREGIAPHADAGAHRRFYEAQAAAQLLEPADVTSAADSLTKAVRSLPDADNTRACQLAKQTSLPELINGICQAQLSTVEDPA